MMTNRNINEHMTKFCRLHVKSSQLHERTNNKNSKKTSKSMKSVLRLHSEPLSNPVVL